jgi:hypothetical protein
MKLISLVVCYHSANIILVGICVVWVPVELFMKDSELLYGEN